MEGLLVQEGHFVELSSYRGCKLVDCFFASVDDLSSANKRHIPCYITIEAINRIPIGLEAFVDRKKKKRISKLINLSLNSTSFPRLQSFRNLSGYPIPVYSDFRILMTFEYTITLLYQHFSHSLWILSIMASGSSSQDHQFPSHGAITMPSPLPEPMTPLTQFIDVCKHCCVCVYLQYSWYSVCF